MIMQDKSLQKQDFNADDIRQLLVAKGNKVQPSDAEVTTFLRVAQGMGANPFLGDIYLIKYTQDSPASTVTGKDYFTKVARSLGGSWKAGLIIQRGDDVIEVEGEFKLKTDTLLGGWAIVHTKDATMPFGAKVSLEEYSSNQSTWKKMPHTMIRKVALVHSLREAYPEKLGGLYDSSEMQQAIPQVDLVNAVEDTPIVKAPSVVEPPKVITTTVKEIIQEQEPPETVVEEQPQQPSQVMPPQQIDKPTVIVCPIHGGDMALREGKYGEYYSHNVNNTWCNNSLDKPSEAHKNKWLGQIVEKYGETTGNTVLQESDGQGILWWLARLDNADMDVRWCTTCGDMADEIINNDWYCVEHPPNGN